MKRIVNWKRYALLGALGIAIVQLGAFVRDYFRVMVPDYSATTDTVVEISILAILFLCVLLPILRQSKREDEESSGKK
jgi:membrane protein DedA with SNARE-associated domain